MTEDLENTLCICGEQNCPDHAAHEVANEHARADINIDEPESLKGRFDMDLTREQAIKLVEAGLAECPLWVVMSYEYGKDFDITPEDDWCGLCDDDLETIKEDKTYQNFALWLKVRK